MPTKVKLPVIITKSVIDGHRGVRSRVDRVSESEEEKSRQSNCAVEDETNEVDILQNCFLIDNGF
jgi:hypothetical protein